MHNYSSVYYFDCGREAAELLSNDWMNDHFSKEEASHGLQKAHSCCSGPDLILSVTTQSS